MPTNVDHSRICVHLTIKMFSYFVMNLHVADIMLGFVHKTGIID